jgi:hypothetical protein
VQESRSNVNTEGYKRYRTATVRKHQELFLPLSYKTVFRRYTIPTIESPVLQGFDLIVPKANLDAKLLKPGKTKMPKDTKPTSCALCSSNNRFVRSRFRRAL